MGRMKTFTDAGIRANSIVDRDAGPADTDEPEAEAIPTASLFEGPRYRFTLLLGESRTWEGEWTGVDRVFKVCLCCGGPVTVTKAAASDDGRERYHVVAAGDAPRLASFAYCLACDRSGKDGALQRAGVEAAPRKRYAPDGDLRGGCA